MARNISNSEVTNWLSCRLKYWFAHYRNLEPNQMSTPLFRGNLGHEFMQRYAEARIEGRAHEAAMSYAKTVFDNALRECPQFMDTILETKFICERYMAFRKGFPEWKFLSVEQRFDLALNDDMNITIRYDAMVEEIQTGKVLIGDYKFTYDFWSVDDHNLNGQMPKYIAVMKANGYQIDGGFLEEIRTRKLSKAKENDFKELFKRTNYFPSKAKQRNTIRQHVSAGLEIMDYWNGDDDYRELKNIPVLAKHGACKFCDFKEPCASKLDGGDIEHMLSLDFKPNTYGYNNEEEKKIEELL